MNAIDTINQILIAAVQQLNVVSDSSRLDAEVLLAHLLKITRAQLLTRSTNVLSVAEQQSFQQLLIRRLAGEPIAYIVGQREFWSLSLLVTPDTLIPRPETELLVELVLQQKFPENLAIKIADLGTGSGAIALALAHERPHWQIVATDNSEAALRMAKRNALALQITNVEFVLSNWFHAIDAKLFNLIVSNPPYIPVADQHLTQGDVRFEPLTALASGDDGLQDLRELVRGAWDYLLPGGCLLLEHGFDQAEAVRKLLLVGGYVGVVSERDLAGKERVTMGKKA